MAEVETTIRGIPMRVTIPDTVRTDAERNQAIADEYNAGRARPVPVELTLGQRINQTFGSANVPLGPALVRSEEALRPSVEPMVAPTIGAAAGTAAGLATGPAAPVAVPLLTGAGSLAGEAFNQVAGISQPSLEQLALAFGLPASLAGIATGGGQAVRSGLRSSRPGREVMQQEAFEQSDILPGRFTPAHPSAGLYDQLVRFNPQIPMPNTLAAARDLMRGEAHIRRFFQGEVTMLERQQLATLGEQLEAATSSGPRQFADVWPVLQRIGREVGDRSAAGGVEHGAMRHLYAAFNRDLEAAGGASAANATLPAVQILRQATHAYRREAASRDLGEQIYKGRSQQAGSGDQLFNQFNAKPALTWIDHPTDESARLFRGSLSRPELDALRETLQRLNAYPKLRAPMGTVTGSSLAIGRAGVGASLGVATGAALGLSGPVLTPLAAAAGIKATNILYGAASRAISRALMSERGRRWLVQMGPITHQNLALLAAAGRAGAFDEPPALPSRPIKVGKPETYR